MLIYVDFINWKILIYLVWVSSFQSINSSSLSKKKYNGGNFTATLCQPLRSQNTSMRICLIELTEPSDTLNYKPFFKHCILETILHVFLLFTFVWNKIFCSKNWAVFYSFSIWFEVAFDVTVLKAVCFWSSFYKVFIRN